MCGWKISGSVHKKLVITVVTSRERNRGQGKREAYLPLCLPCANTCSKNALKNVYQNIKRLALVILRNTITTVQFIPSRVNNCQQLTSLFPSPISRWSLSWPPYQTWNSCSDNPTLEKTMSPKSPLRAHALLLPLSLFVKIYLAHPICCWLQKYSGLSWERTQDW